jgi:4-hydroxybenzoate polyprenyltransferase
MSRGEPLILALNGGLLGTDPALERWLAGFGRGGAATLRADLMPVLPAALAEIDAARADGRAVMLAAEGHEALAGDLVRLHGLDGVSPGPGARLRRGWALRDLVRALRPHQWVKNILLLLPLLAAHRFDIAALIQVCLGMVAFSAAASSIYVVNDLLDLEADRLHPKKCRRPFASGAVPLRVGMAVFGILVILALGLSAALGAAFLGVTVLYVCLSLAYSMRLKRLRWVDIGILAALYSIRVVAGAAAVEVGVSAHLMLFIFPVFVTLGAVKRLTELTLATSDARLPGRGYGRPDRGALLNLSVAAMIASLGAFVAYSFSAQAHLLYPDRFFLWLAVLPLAAWLFRMVRLGFYGKQDYDPIVFALRDKRGIGLILITLSMMFYAAGLWGQWFGF